jgi:hypothetical protein
MIVIADNGDRSPEAMVPDGFTKVGVAVQRELKSGSDCTLCDSISDDCRPMLGDVPVAAKADRPVLGLM